MSRIRSTIAAVLLLLSYTPHAALAQTGGSLRVTDRTNLRDRASSEAATVVSVNVGEVLQILEVADPWFRVRTTAGREGFINRLFVERIAAQPQPPGTAPSAPQPSVPPATTAPSPPQTARPSSQSIGSGFRGGNEPYGNRRLGVGAANNGASLRYWMNERIGLQLDGALGHNYGYLGTAISPSLLVHLTQPKSVTVLTFLPYLGAGATFSRYDTGYQDYYCQRFTDCSSRTMAFGGFVGTEAVVGAIPGLGLSATVGYYSEALGYGGVVVGVGAHYFFGAR